MWWAVMVELTVALFALTSGFTASGIVANTYRLLAGKAETQRARTAYFVVMVVAGPSMIFESAVTSYRAKKCTIVPLWLATLVSVYWSFAIGLLLLSVAIAI